MQIYQILAFGLISILFLLIGFILFVYQKLYVKKSEKSPVMYHDSCDSNTAKFKYLVKITFGKMRRNFSFAKCSFTVVLLTTTKRTITSFAITSHMFANHLIEIDGTDQKVLKIVLLREQRLENIGRFKVYHDIFDGEIFVYKLEFQDLRTYFYTRADINEFIAELSPNSPSGDQQYKSVAQASSDTPVLGRSLLLNEWQYLSLSYLFLNSVFSIAIIIFIDCNENPVICWLFELFGGDPYSTGCMAGVVACLSTAGSAAIYRYYINVKLSKFFNTGVWLGVKYLFMANTIVPAFIFGFLSAIYVDIKVSEEKDKTYSNWLRSIIMSTIVTMFFGGTCAIIAYYYHFFSDKK